VVFPSATDAATNGGVRVTHTEACPMSSTHQSPTIVWNFWIPRINNTVAVNPPPAYPTMHIPPFPGLVAPRDSQCRDCFPCPSAASLKRIPLRGTSIPENRLGRPWCVFSYPHLGPDQRQVRQSAALLYAASPPRQEPSRRNNKI
jgi:hypothetical protein